MMSDSEYFKSMCKDLYVTVNNDLVYQFIERVGIKVDSGINIDMAREQAFFEGFV